MSRRTSPKIFLSSLTISIVLLMMNPGAAFAGSTFGGTPVFPTCTPGADPDDGGPLTQTPDAVLVTGITENGVLGGMDAVGGSFSYQFIADPGDGANELPMLEFTENWTTSSRSYILICGIDANIEYQIKKIITNDTPNDSWFNFENELLDPCCSTNDLLEDQADADHVAILGDAWSHSNNLDGFSFAMGTQDALRFSSVYLTIAANEAGTIDFVRYEGDDGPLNPTFTDNFMSFATRDNTGDESPHILTQIPNFESLECPPGTALPPGGGNIPVDCVPTAIGGILEGVDTTELLVTGAQMNAAWLIPILVSAIGIGIVLARKLRN